MNIIDQLKIALSPSMVEFRETFENFSSQGKTENINDISYIFTQTRAGHVFQKEEDYLARKMNGIYVSKDFREIRSDQNETTEKAFEVLFCNISHLYRVTY